MAGTEEKRKWLARLGEALKDDSFVKLTLAGYRGTDQTLKNVYVRPVLLREGARWAFVYRYSTKDLTKNFSSDEALALVSDLVGSEFRHAHLYTTRGISELEFREGRSARLIERKAIHNTPPSTAHDHAKERSFPLQGGWLQALGVTGQDGKVRRGMESKHRQIYRFLEVLSHLMPEALIQRSPDAAPLEVVDMGCGKGYLTFATCEWFRHRGVPARIRGIEVRKELVDQANKAAAEATFAELHFEAGTIENAKLPAADLLIALHACDTATDEALANGVRCGASLLVVSPCCHKELRPQIKPPPEMKALFRHGILRERHAEVVTDALRAAILEWAGYETKVFEFISPEHSGKNMMLAATKRRGPHDAKTAAAEAQALAVSHGLTSQRLAACLNFDLKPVSPS